MNISRHGSCGVHMVLYEQGVRKDDHDPTILASALVFFGAFQPKDTPYDGRHTPFGRTRPVFSSAISGSLRLLFTLKTCLSRPYYYHALMGALYISLSLSLSRGKPPLYQTLATVQTWPASVAR